MKFGLKNLITNSTSVKVAYHDPCELGRLNKIYDAPRKLLLSIPLIQLEEPFRTNINSWCCGAGAGVQAGYPDLCQKIAADRYGELQDPGADYIITACPNCTHALGQVGKIYDLIEFLTKFLI
ncbi:MAG: heterodisulfide reductase-related iron-sulfur binding cluster [Candidatus Helarchaeota archaeon]